MVQTKRSLLKTKHVSPRKRSDEKRRIYNGNNGHFRQNKMHNIRFNPNRIMETKGSPSLKAPLNTNKHL